MHYRHSYHAGNFADVFKHVLLCGLLLALKGKDKPWCYVDTHAGAGLYDLSGEGATRTGEWEDGIGRLASLGDEAAEPLATYLRLVRAVNPEGKLRHYPGSPAFAQALASDSDRLLLCEKVSAVADELKIVLGRDARVGVHMRDGYDAYSLLPPAEKRGLVLVDPPFERTDEYEAIAEVALKSLARFSNGIFALWYPIKNRHAANGFLRRIGRGLTQPALNFEFDNGAASEGQMHACGVFVINPPFQFEAEMQPVLKQIAKLMAQGPKPMFTCTRIKPE